MKKEGLTIGFDAKRAFCNMTGLGNYSRLVIGTVAGMYPGVRDVLLTPRECPNDRMDRILMRENVSVVTPRGLWRRVPSLWRTVAACADAASAGCDIYHGLSNEIPAGPLPIPTVVTVHDLIWRRVPEDYAAVDRRLYDLKYGRSVRRATRIIAISERTRDDIVADWHVDPSRIDVIYQGCDAAFTRAVTLDDKLRVRAAYGLDGRYIITVGTVQSRKNQLLSVRALGALPVDVKLVIVGRGDRRYGPQMRAEIGRLGLSDRVKWLENVPFADLPALYAAAELSAYTSRYEGFGIPVIESLNCGTPVVACTGSCLEEAGGPGALYVAPDDTEGCAAAMNSILSKAYLRDRLAGDGRRYVKRFSADGFAGALMATYNKAILNYTIGSL